MKSINHFLKSRVFIFSMCLLSTAVAWSEPYLAQRFGQKCSACHTNMTGGGMRNATGNIYATSLGEKNISSHFSPQLTDAISVGANFRGDWTYAQFDTPETVPETGTTEAEIEDTSAFNVSNGSLYLGFALSDDIVFYLDRQVAPEGGRTREALALFKGLFGESSYLKVGKFYLPYGLRLQDDEEFIRQNTGFNFDNSDVGMEIGFEPGNWSLNVAISNGTQGAGENNTDKQVSLRAAYIHSKFRLGASANNNNSINGLGQESYNIFGGINLGKWNLLSEIDFIKNSSPIEEDVNQIATFLSANYPVNHSLNIKLSYGYFDPNDDLDEDEQTRASLIAEKFYNQYTQIRIGTRLLDGIPQSAIQNQSQLFTELHLFF